MDYFHYDSAVIMNGRTLQALGSAYDEWVEELWRRRILNNCEIELAAAPDDNTILPPDANNSSASSRLTKLFINDIFSKQLITPRNCTLLDVKKVLAESCRIGPN